MLTRRIQLALFVCFVALLQMKRAQAIIRRMAALNEQEKRDAAGLRVCLKNFSEPCPELSQKSRSRFEMNAIDKLLQKQFVNGAQRCKIFGKTLEATLLLRSDGRVVVEFLYPRNLASELSPAVSRCVKASLTARRFRPYQGPEVGFALEKYVPAPRASTPDDARSASPRKEGE
jgi:hypothetical protein